MSQLEVNALDRVLLAVAPKWALERIRSRAAATTITRHYNAASTDRRTSGWTRSSTDANMAAWGALGLLRWHSREALRNDGWAGSAQRSVGRNVVGWGIVPEPSGPQADLARTLWSRWAGSDENYSTECDADRRCTFAGMQRLIIDSIFASGEVLIRRRWRRKTDNHTIPLQLQVLEADFLDINRSGFPGPAGGPTIQGVEFDQLGRRTAYWLFDQHPGSGLLYTPLKSGLLSKRVPAEEILHLYRIERPGQVRGVPWLAPVLVKLKDFDEWDDATLMRQKIAACFSAFVTDLEGTGENIGDKDPDDTLEALEPGMITYLPPGKEITFGNPPALSDGTFSEAQLRKIAAGVGVSFEELTGDYSKVNFSSGRMGRIAYQANVEDWRWLMLVPQFCHAVWEWAMEAAVVAGEIKEGDMPGATWTAPPLAMLEPDKEGLALQRMVRSGAMTPSQMIRERGGVPKRHWKEYADDLKELDAQGIVLDCDPRRTTQAGLAQADPDATSEPDPADPAEEPEAEDPKPTEKTKPAK